jgi:hypothetical protein
MQKDRKIDQFAAGQGCDFWTFGNGGQMTVPGSVEAPIVKYGTQVLRQQQRPQTARADRAGPGRDMQLFVDWRYRAAMVTLIGPHSGHTGDCPGDIDI